MREIPLGRTRHERCHKARTQVRSFAEFYPFYLSEHSDRTCRRLHFAGSTLALLCPSRSS